MKRKTKLTLGALALGVMAVGLTACTASFCNVADKSQVMYAYDVYNVVDANGKNTGRFTFGISTYYDASDATKPASAVPVEGFDSLYVNYDINSNLALKQINANATKQNVSLGDYKGFWSFIDNYFLNQAYDAAVADGLSYDKATMTSVVLDDGEAVENTVTNLLIGDRKAKVKGYGYLKYAGVKTNDDGEKVDTYFANWDKAYSLARQELGVDNCPSTDYVKIYQSSMSQFAAAANSCLASENGFYGYYGFDNKNKTEVFIEAKDWSDAWSRGFFEGLLVYPIGWLVDATTKAFMGAGGGVAQVLAIVVITFLIRALMMVFTINQTTQTAKMSEIQPEVLKIQAKYPNANSNRSEQQSMAMETQALYKKYKIHPFLSILVMILQFPIFICVWGAMTGSAVLASDTFLGLRLSDSVSTTLFDVTGWPGNPGWWTALVVFILMAGLQIVSMLLPQIIQKKKQKKLAHLGKNPAMAKQNSTMKWVSIIMMIMVIFMGFSLASGMVIYWIAGSIWTIAQTLIIELITYLKKKNKGKPRKKKPAKVAAAGADGNVVIDAEVIPEAMAAPTGKKKYKKGSKK